MRINRYVASSSELSRRAADAAIAAGRVLVNGQTPVAGQEITEADKVTLDGRVIMPAPAATLMLNKPRGYVVSRNGQGSSTIYDLVPPEYHHLNAVGRLDKDSSGLLLLTSDGALAQELTHPSHQKTKVYEVTLDKPLQPLHRQMISDHGIMLDDGRSQLLLERLRDGDDTAWQVHMHEGRNRQIRRTFAAVGYMVQTLHRTQFGPYSLGELPHGTYRKT
ncbi:MAG TPA: pseudouridine synthase [Candidatus Saccharimonadales bacterium]|nr:pseudouridine synthase [Candidatus Saccharimonadales bacterium]